jgi:putrescine importer
MASTATESDASAPHLHRVLRLRDLIIYGIIIIQPTAPMPIYGVVSQIAHGHVATTILIAMVAMLFTAFSYGRMARAYPSAGSAYTYVGNTLHPGLGYLTGWSITMDYLLNPIICTILCADFARNFLPMVPHPVFAVGFALLFTMLNLRGIETSARVNQWLAAAMGVVVVVFLGFAVRYVFGQHPSAADFLRPFYDPTAFSWPALSRGTALAVLTYIGFDGISTLAEEVENPQKNIPLATVLVCLITGVLAGLEVYAGQMIWPDYRHYPDIDTAFVHVAGRAGGAWLFSLINVTLLVATVGSGMASQLGAARLLYGMGRDNVIPRGFFAAVSKRGTPANNVLLSGAMALAGSLTMTLEFGVELLNFGAFIAFMGVNVSALVYGYRRGERSLIKILPPILGFLVCFGIWLGLSPKAKIVGATWLTVGLLYGATRGSLKRRPTPASAEDAPPSDPS